MSETATAKVNLQPLGMEIEGEVGTVLADLLAAAGLQIPLDCGGNGSCGRCVVRLEGQLGAPVAAELEKLSENELAAGWRLACQTELTGDVVIHLPQTVQQTPTSWPIDDGDHVEMESDSPLMMAVSISCQPPTLDDSRGDLQRVLTACTDTARLSSPPTADYRTGCQVAALARQTDWQLNCYLRENELVGVSRPGRPPLGLAVDLGSTKLAAYLIDLQSGKLLSAKGRLNPQISFGADVITRLQKAVKSRSDSRRLTGSVRTAIDQLASELVDEIDASKEEISEMALVGNSVMVHLLLDLPLQQLGSPPFVAAIDSGIRLKTRELGWHFAPGACLYIPPLIGGFVGADNTSMILGADLDRSAGCRLGLDIGTNTEIVLVGPGRNKPLLITSAPSGPTFEGAHLSSGMRAIKGAIGKVWLDDGQLRHRTVDGSRPAGLCGSGIIDAIAALLEGKIINAQGHLDRRHERVVELGKSVGFLLVPASESATSRNIFVTQADISQVQLAKGAIRAAGQSLLAIAGLAEENLDEVILAGSFGSHIDINTARRIGLIPDIPRERCHQIGNGAGRGVQLLLNSLSYRARAERIPQLAEYIELTRKGSFNTRFARCLAFG